MERETHYLIKAWQRALPMATSWPSGQVRFRNRSGPRHDPMTPCLILVLAATLSPALPSLAEAPPQTVENFLSEAKQLEEKQDYDRAIKIYLQASSAFPDHPEILERLGVMYQTQLKFAESIQTFQRVLALNPQYPETNFYLGVSYLGYNDYNKALEYFDQELKFHPEYRRAHLYAAKALLALGREGEAVQHYQTLTRQDPKDTRVWFELASLYRSLALHAYKQLETIDPDSVLLEVLRAEADADDLRYQDAIKRYEQALKKQPDFPGLHFALGQTYYKMDKPVEAEPELRLGLKEDPDNPPANYMLGQILLHNGKAEEALPFLRVAVNGDPTFMKGQLELGKCYLQLGQTEEAQRALSRAVDADPHSPAPHVLLVQVYTQLHDEEKRKSELSVIQTLESETRERMQGAIGKAAQKDE
ncbi:MAG TPA: tetratricopeptide repeat protein [Terriglobia bacterium]|nr:tetratricopeptide repeat protein [Terriglobia bacterium]